MPAPIVLRNLTPEVKKVDNPPVGEPIIATRADLRDGTRSNSGGPSEPPTYTGDWLSHSQASRAPAPLLRFTDLISGPATGLGDGVGSGAAVNYGFITKPENTPGPDSWPFSKGIKYSAATNWTHGKRHPKTGMRVGMYK